MSGFTQVPITAVDLGAYQPEPGEWLYEAVEASKRYAETLTPAQIENLSLSLAEIVERAKAYAGQQKTAQTNRFPPQT